MLASSRLKFLCGSAALSVPALIHFPAQAAEFSYRSANQLQVDNPIHAREVQAWEAVAKESKGRLVVQTFPQGQLGGQTALISQLRLGGIQFLSVINSSYSDFIPSAGIDGLGYAFKDSKTAYAAMNGKLGEYVAKEFAAQGLTMVKGSLIGAGMRQITSSTKPIRTADDLAGFKIRVPPAKISIDLFQTLGASPVALNQTDVYTGLQSHLIDGQETPTTIMYSNRIFEVQKYLSITNHMWTGTWVVANSAAWKALPPDLQAMAIRNLTKYCKAATDDFDRLESATVDKVKRLGMLVNTANEGTMRARLGPYFGRWKREFGPTVWGLLEDSVGKLG